MRGIRIAAFALAAILVCLVISHIFTIEPAGDPALQPDASADLGNRAGPPPLVPPPPALTGQPAAQPAKKRAAPSKVAKAEPELNLSQESPGGAQQDAQADAKPVIWRGEREPVETAPGLATTPVAIETAWADEPKGPVIVVPRERPKEENRGWRWLKAVGHALGIGGPEDLAEQAFR